MGPIDDMLASVVVAQLLFLQSESAKKPIHMYINSPGGSVTSGNANKTLSAIKRCNLLSEFDLYFSATNLLINPTTLL